MFQLVKDDAAGIATVVIDRPPANAIGEADVAGLRRVLDQLADWTPCRAVLFCGGARFFSAGADIAMMTRAQAGAREIDELAAFASNLQGEFQRIENLPVVTIAAIAGTATGGGLELALCCDLRIAAEDARLGTPEVKLGLLPGAGGTQRLVDLVGLAHASHLVLTGELISGRRAREIGLVQEALPADQVDRRAAEIAAVLAQHPRLAIAAAKKCLKLARSAEGFAAEISETRKLYASAETIERIGRFVGSKRVAAE